jgi:dipeptidyl aminopeptidase/acylaminoacyl peptidase
VKRELERIDIPGEHDARERTWAVVQAAFAEQQPVVHRTRRLRPALALAAVLAVVAAALSPPGRAVLDEIREVVGVERAQPALFSLPAPGRLLVSSDAGVWIVQQDGSRRLLGEYREASWSPFGRFVVAAGENELAALELDGTVRWTLPRRDVHSPRWAGTETDTRIAYFDRTGLRIVAGDSTGDRLLVPRAKGLAAWRPPGPGRVIAHASATEVRVLDVDTGRTLWRAPRGPAAPPTSISWSSDGRRLLVLSPRVLLIYDRRGRPLYELGPGAAPVRNAALAPTENAVAIVQEAGGRSQTWLVPRVRPDASAARRVFAGAGSLAEISWSPDGRWLLLSWPTADQWVFVRADGGGIRAVSNISEQFRSRPFPRIEGWCCAR